ncbi:TonB-dependent receptor [Salegentibacter maritimus]|uniref:TonB-dependent receptor n=1 Tax=Salegentibacter maritimus TaxID=2794347 RepID=UPI0018E4940E|nr:TonB-dependent receptor [Salegentibacter maritimus]MBI6118139.1 TonB-dependent receptor [Salegentibacter maritimus]
MRVLLILIGLGLGSSYANSSYSQTKIDIALTDANLIEFFEEIQANTEFVFFYKDDILQENLRISVSLKKASLENILKSAFSNTSLDYKISDKQVVVKKLAQKSNRLPSINSENQQETLTVTGTVTEAKTGMPVPAANILEIGTSNGVMTDFDGNYSIDVPKDAVLKVSYIGYAPKEIQVNNRSEIDIVLEEDAAALDEVVVVGYGTQKRENLTGALSSMDFDETIENRPVTDASQALSGKMSGVWVSQNSGLPGEDASTIRIRGIGTLNNSSPLVLINGVEGKLSEINPNDIESITVLKDAASAAIYGSRAANGVVLVKTKQGTGGEAQISYNGYFGLQQIGRKYDLITNSAEYMDIWNIAVTNSGGDPLFPQDVIEGFRTGDDQYRYPNTNYLEEIFRTSPITEHNVSIRGGSEKSNYYLSFNFRDQEGIVRNTNSEKYGINLSLSNQVKDWLKVEGNVQASRKKYESPYDEISRALYLTMNGHPFSSPYNSNGEFGATQAIYEQGENAGKPIVDTRNPFPDLFNGKTLNVVNYLNVSGKVEVSLSPYLKFNSTINGQVTNGITDRYNELNYAYTEDGFRTLPLDYEQTITNQRNNSNEFYWVNFNTINFDKTYNEVHNFSSILGMQVESNEIKTTGAQKSDPPKEGIHQVDAATSNAIANGNRTEWKMLSYFGRINYNFDQKYLFEANLRADASSRFRKGNKWGVFPSFSAGWNISKEDFFNITSIDRLKLRASWGELGNQNINLIAGNYPYLTTVTQSNGTSYNFQNQFVPGTAITELVDRDISWETTKSIDIGLEATFLDNRISFEADYFNKLTEDILVRLPVPLILGGVSSPIQNIGEMRNEGVELLLNYQSHTYEKDWTYNIGGNISFIENKVERFLDDSPDQLYLIREGFSYNTLYGLNAIGVYQSEQEIAEHIPQNSYQPKPGDLKYDDLNGDQKIDYRDKKVMGNTVPKITYGLSLGTSYKNWNINMVAQGIADVSSYTQNAWTEPLGISGGSITKRWRNAWTEDSPSSSLPSIKVNDTWNRRQSSFWVSDLSYLKIKNIQLSYDVSKSIMDDLGLKSATAYMNMSNVYTFVNNDYEGFDPERSTFDSGGYVYPAPRIMTIGLNINF